MPSATIQRAVVQKLIFDGDVIKKIVSDPRIVWKDKYLTRKTSAIQWLNSEANRPGFKAFTAEPFYNNAWQQIWNQGTLPVGYSGLDADHKKKLEIYLEIANEVVQDALSIDASGVPISQIVANRKADFIFRRSGLRAWIVGKNGDKIRVRMETGYVSDWQTIKDIEKDAKRA